VAAILCPEASVDSAWAGRYARECMIGYFFLLQYFVHSSLMRLNLFAIVSMVEEVCD
jgi:hypothetical protein